MYDIADRSWLFCKNPKIIATYGNFARAITLSNMNECF